MDIVVRPVPRDDRKVPWVWETRATAAQTLKRGADGASQGPIRQVMLYRGHFQAVPRGSVTYFWVELRGMQTGTDFYARRRFELSEWNRGFRMAVTAAWLGELEKRDRKVGNGKPATDDQKDTSFALMMSRLAKQFEITDEELKDIISQPKV
jgi:hypothetical protein